MFTSLFRKQVSFFIIVNLLLVLSVPTSVFAGTTIGTNISTDGDLAVDGNTRLGTASGSDTITLNGYLNSNAIFIQGTAREIGIADSTTTHAAGADLTLEPGGGNGTGNGGVLHLKGGTGATSGTGGNVALTSGAGGSTSGASGTVVITTGAPTDGNSGAVTLSSANAVGTNRDAGAVNITGGNSTGTGTAGAITITAGNGVGANANTDAGDITITAGTGGTGDVTGGNSEIIAGAGGTGGTSAIGGKAKLTGGAGGAASLAAAGGTVDVTGGAGGVGVTTGGNGGAANITGGAGGGANATGGNGGAVNIIGGAGAATSGYGGAIVIRGGAKNGSGITGTITIGDTDTSSITIGSTTAGLRYYEDTETVSANDTLTAAESGKTFYLSDSNGGTFLTLPAPASGVWYRFVLVLAFDTADIQIGTTSSANIIYGTFTQKVLDNAATGNSSTVTCTASSDTINFDFSTETIGDWVEVRSNGTNWFMTGQAGLANGLECIQVSP